MHFFRWVPSKCREYAFLPPFRRRTVALPSNRRQTWNISGIHIAQTFLACSMKPMQARRGRTFALVDAPIAAYKFIQWKSFQLTWRICNLDHQKGILQPLYLINPFDVRTLVQTFFRPVIGQHRLTLEALLAAQHFRIVEFLLQRNINGGAKQTCRTAVAALPPPTFHPHYTTHTFDRRIPAVFTPIL